MSKTIFITGASTGFGKLWAEAFLKRGDNVAATSRNLDGIKHLSDKYGKAFLPIQLDITNRAKSFEAVNKAKAHFGTLDVVINNAGYGVFGAIEENSEEEARAVVEANLFGTLWITQAALPIFREQGKGHIIQLSSVLGLNSLPTLGIYGATKFAVEGFSESLQAEVKEFGINVTLVEPNGYKTEFGGISAVQSKAIAAYDKVKTEFRESAGMSEDATGNPEATVDAILQLVDSKNPPLRFLLGKLGHGWTKQNYASKFKEWEEWNDVAVKAHGK